MFIATSVMSACALQERKTVSGTITTEKKVIGGACLILQSRCQLSGMCRVMEMEMVKMMVISLHPFTMQISELARQYCGLGFLCY